MDEEAELGSHWSGESSRAARGVRRLRPATSGRRAAALLAGATATLVPGSDAEGDHHAAIGPVRQSE